MHRATFLFYRAAILWLGLFTMNGLFAQSLAQQKISESDTLVYDSIHFTAKSASEYINRIVHQDNLWKPEGYKMKHSLERLLDHSIEPFDSVESRITKFIYKPVELSSQYITENDTLPLRWLNDSIFFIDTVSMDKKPFITKLTITKTTNDSLEDEFSDDLTEVEAFIDSLFGNYAPAEEKYDTIKETIIDTAYIKSKGIELYTVFKNRVHPPLVAPDTHKSVRFLPDSGKIVISDTLKAIVAAGESPFYIIPDKRMPDSLLRAVETLISYTIERDSILIYFNDIHGHRTPFWITNGTDELYRYWVRNYKNDSITIWMGNPSKNDISFILEEDVDLNRIQKEGADNIPITLVKPQFSLAKINPLKEIPVY